MKKYSREVRELARKNNISNDTAERALELKKKRCGAKPSVAAMIAAREAEKNKNRPLIININITNIIRHRRYW